MSGCVACGSTNCNGMCVYANVKALNPGWWAFTQPPPTTTGSSAAPWAPVKDGDVTGSTPAPTGKTSSSRSPDYLIGFAAGVKACKEKIAEFKYDMEKLGRDWSPRDVPVKGE